MITSVRNDRVARAVRLKKRALREREGLFLVEGPQAVMEALGRPGLVREIFREDGAPALEAEERGIATAVRSARAQGIPVHGVSPSVMGRLTSTVTPQGLVAVTRRVDVPLAALAEADGCVAVLVEVRDPGNAGTILRSAHASGAAAALFTKSSVDIYNQKAVRASAGSLFHLPVVREVEVLAGIAALRGLGYRVLAAAADGEASVYRTDLSGKVAVLFGNEAHGLPEGVLDRADGTVRVPIEGSAESLNLAAAAAVLLFEAARQRAAQGAPDPIAPIVTGAAHDLRSPLTALKGFASTLGSRWDRLSEDQRRTMVDGIEHDAARMENVLAELVDAARLSMGSLLLHPVPTDVLATVNALKEELDRWSWGDLAVAGDTVTAMADPAKLRSMVRAMCESALWWGEEGPVRVEVRGSPRPAVVVSRDSTSLGPEAARALLEPRAAGSGGGSKLGLFVAKGLAEAQGGSLDAWAGDAVRFTLTLPGVEA